MKLSHEENEDVVDDEKGTQKKVKKIFQVVSYVRQEE